MSILYNRIETLCELAGINVTQMCKNAGISRGSLSDLKGGRKKTLKAETLSKIARYFDESVDYLLGNWPGSDAFGERLAALRKEKKLPVADIAGILGIDPADYLEYEKGHIAPTISEAERLCAVLEMPKDYLFINTDAKKVLVSRHTGNKKFPLANAKADLKKALVTEGIIPEWYKLSDIQYGTLMGIAKAYFDGVNGT